MSLGASKFQQMATMQLAQVQLIQPTVMPTAAGRAAGAAVAAARGGGGSVGAARGGGQAPNRPPVRNVRRPEEKCCCSIV